jgi:hypothetical protein
LREDALKLKEENTKVEGLVESCNELITEIAKEIVLDRMGEDAEADNDDGGDTTAPAVAVTPPPAPVSSATAIPEEIIEEEDPVEMVLDQEAPVVHEVILADPEPELPQSCLYRMLMRDYEESPSRRMDDRDDLDDPTKACSDMDEWFPEDGSNDRD